jgi:VWFA-related protein
MAFGLAMCAGAVAAAQTPAPPSFEAVASLVSLTVVVRDQQDRFVRGLGPTDVRVLEDGVPQEVAFFREASEQGETRPPLSVVLVLDSSGSMRHNLPLLQEAAVAFVERLADPDRALVVQFNESVKGSAEFTSDADRLEQFILALEAWGGTSLYDAIRYSLGRVRDQPGRKAVVVFTDGADTTSTIKEGELIDYARSVEATVYSVGIRGEEGLFARSPRGFLRKIANETGGEFFFPERAGELLKIFTRISDELHSHYLLGYAPKRTADGSWRAIEVKVPGKKDVSVRVRKGYFARRH